MAGLEDAQSPGEVGFGTTVAQSRCQLQPIFDVAGELLVWSSRSHRRITAAGAQGRHLQPTVADRTSQAESRVDVGDRGIPLHLCLVNACMGEEPPRAHIRRCGRHAQTPIDEAAGVLHRRAAQRRLASEQPAEGGTRLVARRRTRARP